MKLAYTQDPHLAQMGFVYSIPRLVELLLGDQPDDASFEVSVQREGNRVISHYQFDTGTVVERVFVLVDLNTTRDALPTAYKVEFVNEGIGALQHVVGGNFWHAGAPADDVAAAIARAIARFFVDHEFPDVEQLARRAMLNYAIKRKTH